MRRMTILLLLPLAVACLRCGADRAGMRDAISFITGELDLVLSAAVDLPGNEGENGRKAGRGLDKTNHDITGIQHGIGGRGTGGDNRVSNASVKKKRDRGRKNRTGPQGRHRHEGRTGRGQGILWCRERGDCPGAEEQGHAPRRRQ